ncbi:hypothetical protein [Kurthia huakuii]|uniref:hypothetical protein n=1 Tax=Kurthia huakuii TaxID=1421019 RepID=UPI0004959A3D|nr:hypothetical protein [Kurthia huakuii]MBM7698064.1 hypothetical protein [Kurthia huakuii]
MLSKTHFQVQELSKILSVIAAVSLLGMVVSYFVYGYQHHYAALIFIIMTLFIASMIFHDKNKVNRTQSK